MFKVIPLHKKGLREAVGDFRRRPISLFSTFSNVIEKVLRRIFDHLTQNNLQTDRQLGFPSRRPTLFITSLVDIVEYAVNSIEQGKTVLHWYLSQDMMKAFDCLDHNLILEKLLLCLELTRILHRDGFLIIFKE